MTEAGRFDARAVVSERAARSWRRMPSVLRAAFGIVWTAAPRTFLVAGALQVVGGLAVAGQLLAGKALVERLLDQEDGSVRLGPLLWPLAVLALLTALVTFSEQSRLAYQRLLGSLVGHHALRGIHAVTVHIDLLAFESPDFHNRLQRSMINALTRPLQLVTGALTLLSSCFAVIGVGVALLVVEPLLLLLTLLAYVPTWYMTTKAAQHGYAFSVNQTERDRRRLYLNELLTGKDEAKEVRAFGLSDFLVGEHERLAQASLAELRGLVRRQLRLRLTGSAATSVLSALTVLVLLLLVTNGRTDVAAAATAAVAVLLLGARLRGVAAGASGLYEGSLFVDDYLSFVAQVPTLRRALPTAAAPPSFEALHVEDVSFTYPGSDRAALSSVDVTIRAGEVVALVGENGSGKTTLAKLIAGLWEPTSGRIRWDEVDLATVAHEQRQRGVAVLFQDFIRYQLSAGENVSMGDPARRGDEEAVRSAARQAGVLDTLLRLPDGLATRLGPEFYGGTELSGGQWQRLALARAFFRDTPFLVLDEPSAALDPRAEHELFEAVRSLADGRTVLLISHRFSSVRSADRILVLERGRLVEQGDHDQLMVQGGVYADLFTLQASAYLDRSVL